MMQKQLKKKYVELLNNANEAQGRKETISLLHKAEKIRTKIIKTTSSKCSKCNGSGYLRLSIDEAKTCLECFGKGYIKKSLIKI